MNKTKNSISAESLYNKIRTEYRNTIGHNRKLKSEIESYLAELRLIYDSFYSNWPRVDILDRGAVEADKTREGIQQLSEVMKILEDTLIVLLSSESRIFPATEN